MLTFGAAVSTAPDHTQALDEVIPAALGQLRGAPDLVVCFFSMEHAGAAAGIALSLSERTGTSAILGCTAQGVIGDGRELEEERRLAYVGMTRAKDRLFLVNARHRSTWGGGAGDNLAMRQTYQYCDDEVVSDGVAYALLSGEALPAWAIDVGYVPIGGERKVTRSQGNVIYEIDGKPATEVLKEYLPEDALTDERDWLRYAISLALCFRAPSYMKDEEYVVRGVPAVKMADGSITVQTEVPEGTSVWLSSRDKEKVSNGFDRMAAQIKEQLGGEKPKLVFQFECATRGKLMFREQEKLQILKRFRQSLDPDVPWVGFYTIGEIGPVEEHNNHHLFTSVVLALS